MTHRISRNLHLYLAVLMAAGALFATACQSKPPKFACSMPPGNDVAAAFGHVRADLSHEECQFQFDLYVDRLMSIAAEEPGSEHARRFSELFTWARGAGILSRSQAQESYQRYFSATFVSLGAQYSNCSTTCRNTAQTLSALRQELADKNRGLLHVLGDQTAYANADKEYNQLLTLIDATCTACQIAR